MHHFWPYLLYALKDSRLPVVVAALDALPDLCHLAGADFMTRRVTHEAWPLVSRLLQGGRPLATATAPATPTPKPRTPFGEVLTTSRDAGASSVLTEHAQVAAGALRALGPASLAPASSTGPAGDDTDAAAPGSQLQMRTAALRCLEAMAAPAAVTAQDREIQHVMARRPGQLCVRLAVVEMMEAALPYLGKSQPLPLQEQAVKTFRSLIPHDDNAAWLLLTDVVRAGDKAAALSSNIPAPTLPAALQTALHAHLDKVRAATDPQSKTKGPMTVRIPAATMASNRAHILPAVSSLLPAFEPGGVRNQGYAGTIEASRLAQCAPRAAKLLEFAGARKGTDGRVSRPQWATRVLMPRAPDAFVPAQMEAENEI